MPLLELPLFTPLTGLTPAQTPLPMPLLPLAEISGAQWIAIAAILGGLTFTILLIFFGLRFVQRRQELWHETARVALEKGQPLPPLPRDMQPAKDPNGNNDMRVGLVMIATGAGLYLFFAAFVYPLRFLAAIPGFIGIALVLYAVFNPQLKQKHPPADRPPQS
jgi:hypothetical protein